MMAVHGHFNHLDDPDEYWDDEPLEIRSPQVAPAVSVPGPAVSELEPAVPERIALRSSANSPLIGAGLFEMRLDDGRLPVHVQVTRSLHNLLDPQDFSAAAMTGYYLALWRHDAPTIVQGRFSALSAPPSRRAVMTTLLGTKSLAEFEAVERALRRRDEFLGEGPWTDFGSRSVAIAASLFRIGSITIDPRWAATVDPSYIGHDIIDCANQIRQKRPIFHEGGSWAHRSDDELEYELAEYKNYLMRTS